MKNLEYPNKRIPTLDDFRIGQTIPSKYSENEKFEIVDKSPRKGILVKQVNQKKTRWISLNEIS